MARDAAAQAEEEERNGVDNMSCVYICICIYLYMYTFYMSNMHNRQTQDSVQSLSTYFMTQRARRILSLGKAVRGIESGAKTSDTRVRGLGLQMQERSVQPTLVLHLRI